MVQCIQSQSEMNGHGHDFGHKFLDTETIFFWTSDTDMGRVITSDTGSDTHMSENLGHGFGLGHDFGHDFGHGLGQSNDFGHGHDLRHVHVRKLRTRKRTYACPLISVLATQSALV